MNFNDVRVSWFTGAVNPGESACVIEPGTSNPPQDMDAKVVADDQLSRSSGNISQTRIVEDEPSQILYKVEDKPPLLLSILLGFQVRRVWTKIWNPISTSFSSWSNRNQPQNLFDRISKIAAICARKNFSTASAQVQATLNSFTLDAENQKKCSKIC